MKRAKGKGMANGLAAGIVQKVEKMLAQAEKTMARMGGVLLLGKVADAYRNLARGAESVAHGKRAGVDLSPDGEIAKLAESAAKYAARNTLPLTLPGYCGPCETLGEARESLAKLEEWSAAGLWGKRKAKGKEKDSLRLALGEVRQAAARLAERFGKDANFADMQSVALVAHEYTRAKADAQIATLRAKLANLKGDKAAHRKWKRKAGKDRKRAEVLDLYGRIYRAGMKVEEAAEAMGISKRKAEGILAKARKEGLPGFTALPRGRRKSVEVAGNVGIEKAERLEARRGR